jgi:hypothetical protein
MDWPELRSTAFFTSSAIPPATIMCGFEHMIHVFDESACDDHVQAVTGSC